MRRKKLNSTLINEAHTVVSAASNPIRVEIVNFIKRNPGSTVKEILGYLKRKRLNTTNSRVLIHLAKIRRIGLIVMTKDTDQQDKSYTVNTDKYESFVKAIETLTRIEDYLLAV